MSKERSIHLRRLRIEWNVAPDLREGERSRRGRKLRRWKILSGLTSLRGIIRGMERGRPGPFSEIPGVRRYERDETNHPHLSPHRNRTGAH